MKVIDYISEIRFECWFRDHRFSLEKEPAKSLWDGEWYAVVAGPDGCLVHDGYIKDSQDMTVKGAMIEACKGSVLAPPKRWPALLHGER